MIEVYFGENLEEKDRAVRSWITTKRKNGFSVESFEADTFILESFEQLISSGGLFNETFAVIVYYSEKFNEIGEILERIKKEDVNVLMVEHKAPVFDKKFEKHFKEKHFEKTEPVDDVSKKVFALGDALGEKNKKNTWLLYRKLIEGGLDPLQNIYSPLVWGLHNVVMVQNNPQKSHGMKPYPLQKAKKTAQNYSKEEIVDLLEKLLFLYNDRTEGRDIEAQMETILLEATS
jgi:hypothetical protein